MGLLVTRSRLRYSTALATRAMNEPERIYAPQSGNRITESPRCPRQKNSAYRDEGRINANMNNMR